MAEKTINLNITGMTCDHCAETVLRAVNTVPGLIAADVSIKNNTATITYDDTKATETDFTGAIDLEGYGATTA